MGKEDLVNKLFSPWNKADSPGAAVSVMIDGQIIYKNGFGYANLEYDIPITPSTIFHVASVSKQFTAMAILLLEKEGKLSIYDDIKKYIPELHNFETSITIEQLIHHTSGLRDQLELLFLSGWREDDIITKEHLMKMTVRQKTLNFEPGTQFLYSNTGYSLMAEIVEIVSGQSFANFTRENIFKPLNMNNTHFHDDNDIIVKNRAYSYQLDLKHGFKKCVLNYSIVGATSLFTTVEDLAKWGNNFYTCQLGGASTIKRMLEGYTLKNGEVIQYACGVKLSDYNGLKTIEHNGADAGFRSSMVCFPEYKTVVSVFSNLSTFKPEYYAKKLAEIFLPEGCFNKDNNSVLFDDLKNKTNKITNYDIYDLVGTYLINNGTVIKVESEEGKLLISLHETPKLNLLPKSENIFLGENTDILVKWEKDENKNIKGLNIIYPPNDIRYASKVIPIKLSRNELEMYTGCYYCEELGTCYEIIAENNGLVAKHTRHSDCKLISCGNDIFVSEKCGNCLSGEINFFKCQENKITGFKLTTDRAFNLWFSKKNNIMEERK